MLPSDLQSLNNENVEMIVQVGTCRCVLTLLRSTALVAVAKSIPCGCVLIMLLHTWEMKHGRGEEECVHYRTMKERTGVA